MSSAIYLDYAATTPVDPRVAEKMIACLRPEGAHGNPSSASHEFGRRARELVEAARAQVANAIGAVPQSIVWTSGATESDNLAILGVARFHRDRGRHIVSSKTEHKAVLDPLKQLEREGFDVTCLKPDASGIELAGLARDADELNHVLEAMARMESGRYGMCADCGAPIAYERLLAQPQAARCIRCETERERLRARPSLPAL